MEKRKFGKLQLNRETLRNLTTGELEQVVGAVSQYHCSDPEYCGTTGESECYYYCQDTATCGCTGLPGGTCNASADFCTYDRCNSGNYSACC
jgi:hypothetical protein